MCLRRFCNALLERYLANLPNERKPDGEVLRGATHMIIDADTKFTDEFRSLLRIEGVKCVPTPHRAPDCNSVAERWVLSIKSEALNRMIFFGVDSLRKAVSEFVSHYHTERNHQSLDNSIIEPGEEVGLSVGAIHRNDRLGGVLRYTTAPPDHLISTLFCSQADAGPRPHSVLALILLCSALPAAPIPMRHRQPRFSDSSAHKAAERKIHVDAIFGQEAPRYSMYISIRLLSW